MVDISQKDLERQFSKFGEYRELWLARNPPCFAFIVYKHRSDGEEAISAMDGKIICNSRIRVSWARPRTRGRNSQFDPNMRCFQCGERGHFSRDCNSRRRGGYDDRRSSRRRRSRSHSRSRSRSPRRDSRRNRSRSASRDRRQRDRRHRDRSRSERKSENRSRSRSVDRKNTKKNSRSRSRSQTKAQLDEVQHTNGNGRLASRSRSVSINSEHRNGDSKNHLEVNDNLNNNNNNNNNEGDDDHEMIKADISNGDIYDPTKSDCEDDEVNGNAIVNADCGDNVEADLN